MSIQSKKIYAHKSWLKSNIQIETIMNEVPPELGDNSAKFNKLIRSVTS